jgi:hypothetical protein
MLICGDRNWTDKDLLQKVMSTFPPGTTVIHGGARGADSIAGDVAKELGFSVVVFKADWKRFGKAAGVLRNVEMLNDGKPDGVIAFHHDIRKSKGTAHMVKIAKEKGIEVEIYPEQTNLGEWFRIILGKGSK